MPTMQDVAARANVALSTVSYVLSGTRPVGQETRDRVLAAIDELGYQPNSAARSLASRRSKVLSIVLPTQERGLGGTLGEFIDSAVRTAAENGYHLVVWPFGLAQADEIVALTGQGMADGVLLMEISLDDDRVNALERAGAPFTMIGRTRNPDTSSWVDVDFDATLEEAVARLTDLGHTEIGFLNHSAASAASGYGPTYRAAKAYQAAMGSRGLTPAMLYCDDSPAAGRETVGRFLEAHPGLTAVVTMNEMATYGMVAEFQLRGLRIPQDVSILSVVTSPGMGAMSNPPLATMHAPGAELGRLAVLRLLAILEGSATPTAPALVSCTFEDGETLAPAPGTPTA